MSVKRAQCPICRFRWRLRKDGTLHAHRVYCGSEPHQCEGGGKPPRPFSPDERGDCLTRMHERPVGAA